MSSSVCPGAELTLLPSVLGKRDGEAAAELRGADLTAWPELEQTMLKWVVSPELPDVWSELIWERRGSVRNHGGVRNHRAASQDPYIHTHVCPSAWVGGALVQGVFASLLKARFIPTELGVGT